MKFGKMAMVRAWARETRGIIFRLKEGKIVREYVCDNPECSLLMGQPYEGADDGKDYCSEECFLAAKARQEKELK